MMSRMKHRLMVPERINNQCRSADSAVFLVMMRCGSHYSNVKNQAKSYISLNHVLFSSVSTKQLTSKPQYIEYYLSAIIYTSQVGVLRTPIPKT